MSHMLWAWLSPLKLIAKLAPTEVGIFISGRFALTPSPSAANATIFRPFVANSVICCSLIRLETALESA